MLRALLTALSRLHSWGFVHRYVRRQTCEKANPFSGLAFDRLGMCRVCASASSVRLRLGNAHTLQNGVFFVVGRTGFLFVVRGEP
ncbi:hypothetical protein BJ742DRAFT_795441 [Cladochytrium replicatum]|nr:hypothetical protein BJ742DRAFT_795441 [Cladochytrium replicatum]